MVRRFEDILERVQEYNANADLDSLRRAYVFSAREHRDQVRSSGEPYLVHPLEVAYLLAEQRLDVASIVAGLLHDVVEDTLTSIARVSESFGEDVAHIVEGVTKISKLKFATAEHAEAENLRKMILAMVDDVRVILVKLADRLHNMRTLEYLPEAKQKRIARETFEIYAPLANRLGMGRLKGQLEDLSFRYLEPEAYERLTRSLASKRKLSEEFIQDIRGRLGRSLSEHDIQATIVGRIKSMYSIYRKMRVQKISLEEVYDYVAFRILVDSERDCYAALGIVHSAWRPVPGRIKDYIAMPKPNRYQSLHTSLVSEQGHPFEVQIRTRDMHRIAEEGIAAHWQYKEDGRLDDKDAEKVAWLRQILDWQQDLKDPRDFLQMVKVDLYPEEVYAFTPKGRVLSFPLGATPIDFAYRIHTEVGHECSGAKVNGRIVPLRYRLETGDRVEILTQQGRAPSRDWLNIVRTSKAKAKIRAWLNADERVRAVALGQELLEKAFRKYRLVQKNLETKENRARAVKALGFGDVDDVAAAIGYGRLDPEKWLSALDPDLHPAAAKPEGRVSRVVRKVLGLGERAVKVQGLDDVMIHLANCCNPVRGEAIVGYISRGKGVSVHSRACPNITQLMYDPGRRIDVEWDLAVEGGSYFQVKLVLDVEDRQGLLAKIVAAISELDTNIKTVDAETFEGSDARITVVVTVSDREQMEKVIRGLRRIKGVRDVERHLR